MKRIAVWFLFGLEGCKLVILLGFLLYEFAGFPCAMTTTYWHHVVEYASVVWGGYAILLVAELVSCCILTMPTRRVSMTVRPVHDDYQNPYKAFVH